MNQRKVLVVEMTWQLRRKPLFGIPLVTTAIILWSLGARVEAASFDCARAAAPIERIICSDQRLSVLDERLNKAYSVRRANRRAEEAEALITDQRKWLAERLSDCQIPKQGPVAADASEKAVSCLINLYTARIVVLSDGHGSDAAREKSLRQYLQRYEGNPTSPDERTTRYAAAFADLNGDGNDEVVVYLMDAKWCGSGGCSALILAPQGSGYKLITRTTITRLPIRILSTETDGWHDLGVWVQGGGIQPGYEAKLRFNGTKYPSNPSVSPAQRSRAKVEGKVVVPDNAKGVPLYE